MLLPWQFSHIWVALSDIGLNSEIITMNQAECETDVFLSENLVLSIHINRVQSFFVTFQNRFNTVCM